MVPAFEGAKGFGASATGGTGGPIVMVTRLDDPIPSVPGTLRHALEVVRGPRIIRFAGAGVIEAQQPMARPGYCQPTTDRNNITIDGSTAPGDGICLKGHITFGSNNIIRYLRVRQGMEGMNDGLTLWGCNNIIDHCSISWTGDENVGMMAHGLDKPCHTNTVQWCILAESVKGMALDHGAYNISCHHNLFANNYIRNPKIGSPEPHYDWDMLFDIRSNVMYGCGNECICIRDSGSPKAGEVRVNLVGNYCKMGATTYLYRYSVGLDGLSSPFTVPEDPEPPDSIKIFIADHWGPHIAAGEPLWNEVNKQHVPGFGVADEAKHRVFVPFDCPLVTTHSPQETYNLVLAQAGATLPRRDSVDQRIVQDVENGTGQWRQMPEVRAWAAEQWETLQYGGGEEMAEEYWEPESYVVTVNEENPDGVHGFVLYAQKYPVGAELCDEQGVPVAGRIVIVDGQSVTSDVNGIAVLDRPAGTYPVTPQV